MEKITMKTKRRKVSKEEIRAMLKASITLIVMGIVLIAAGIVMIDKLFLAVLTISCGSVETYVGLEKLEQNLKITKRR